MEKYSRKDFMREHRLNHHHLNDAYFECFCDTRLYYADVSICSFAQQIWAWLDLLWHIQIIGIVSFWLCLFTHKK